MALITLENQQKLFRIKSLATQIRDASFAFHKLGKNYTEDMIDNDQKALEIVKAYEEIVTNLGVAITAYKKNGSGNDAT